MKKLSVSLFALVLILLSSGCASAPALPTLLPIPTSTPSKPPIPVMVPRFYNSEGIQVHVGKYSEELRTEDRKELTALMQEMAKQRDQLTPEQMFVLAIRLYDLGQKDPSLYWFYEAQFRAKLFLKAIDTNHPGTIDELSMGVLGSYDAFTTLAGEYINGYAGCDVDNWIKIATAVKDDNPTPPELDKLFPKAVLLGHSQWQKVNDDVGAGLGVLIDQLGQKKDAIRQQRIAKNLDALYCN